MTDYALVLLREFPGREWSLNGNDYSSLVIHDGGSKPTKKALDDLWPKVKSDVAWDAVRLERDRLLAASDWTQVVDSPLTDEVMVAWAGYRQQLRDIPQTFDDPDQVVWPTEP